MNTLLNAANTPGGTVEDTAEIIKIRGGRPLSRRVEVKGAKNLVTKAMVAALLGETASVLRDVPDISDVAVVRSLLEVHGVRVDELDGEEGTLRLDPTGVESAHMEEIDLCWTLRRQGWRIGYTSAVAVHHVGGGALGYGDPRKTYLNFRNSLAVLTKHLNSRWIYARIVHRLTLDVFAALKFLAEGHAAHAWQVGRAHRRFLRWMPRLVRERGRLRRAERNPDLTGMYHRSIAYDRYILGWRRFTDLDPAAFNQPARRTR